MRGCLAVVLLAVWLAGCFGSTECAEPGEPFEPRVAMTTPTELGELQGSALCIGRLDGTPTLVAQLLFGDTGVQHRMTAMVPLPTKDTPCASIDTTYRVYTTLRISPTAPAHPPSRRADASLYIEDARPVPGDDIVSLEGELYFDGTGEPPVDEPDDFGFRFAAPPCDR